MTGRISLNGNDWKFKEYHGADWVWRNACAPDTSDTRWWRKGTVPGSVQDDLWKLGEIANPYREKNSLLCEWVPQRTWVYKKSFHAGAELTGKRVRLVFLGVDYSAQFYFNGEYLGSHEGMFTPASFDVSRHLKVGEENLVAVVIEAAPAEQCQVGYTSAVHTHKSRMGYWWDFCPRLVHIGIWQDVYLEVSDEMRVAEVFVRPILNPTYDRALLDILIVLDALADTPVDLELVIQYNATDVASLNETYWVAAGQSERHFAIELANPRLWWPNGSGAQELYDAFVRVRVNGRVSQERCIHFGIREIRMLPNEGAAPDALPYTFTVNGRKIYIKGWNWVPMDALYGVPRLEKLARLLTLAQRAHVNMLRVWGGGLIEREEFYTFCDRMGILVWQEFIQSSSGIDNTPSDSAEFIALMSHEAEQIIPLKRNHPALAVWCGGNELQSGDETPLDDTHLTLVALKEVVERLDPDRIWLATSPTGRVFSNSLRNIQHDPADLHDVHGPWEYQGTLAQYDLYNQGASLFHSEFGVEGITNKKTLDRVVLPKSQWPVSLENNPYWWHLGAWWVQRPMWDRIFGQLDDVNAYIRATQFIQFDGLRYALEADRRRKFHNSGTLPWQFNEPYPMAACTSAVDYYGQPKPVYYAVAKAYEPVHVSARFDGITCAGSPHFLSEIWICNSRTQGVAEAVITVRLVGASGRSYHQLKTQVSFGANQARRLCVFECDLNTMESVFFLDILLNAPDDDLLSENRYIFARTENLSILLGLPETNISVIPIYMGDIWEVLVRNDGSQAATYIWLQDDREVGSTGHVYFDQNYFCLFPGEARRIRVEWQSADQSHRRVEIGGWNTPGLVINGRE